MTRIVLCANNIDELGGAQKVVRVLADVFGARGHEILAGLPPSSRPIRSRRDETRVLMPQTWPKKSTQTERLRAQLRREAVAGMADIVKTQDSGRAVIITAQVWAMEILADALAAVSPDVRDRWIVVGQYHGAYAAAASGRDLEILAPIARSGIHLLDQRGRRRLHACWSEQRCHDAQSRRSVAGISRCPRDRYAIGSRGNAALSRSTLP